MNAPPRRPPIRLAFGALFWRLFLGFTLLFALIVGSFLVRRAPPGQWLVGFLVFMPMWAATAFFIAALLTVFADLVVRIIVRPRMLSWLAPKGDDFHAAFHLEPRERSLAEAPARMGLGRSWTPGRLVRTERRLLFLPNAWDVEPWSSPLDRLRSTGPVEAPRPFWGLIRGVPPRLEVVADGQPPRRFALTDAPGWAALAGPGSNHPPAVEAPRR